MLGKNIPMDLGTAIFGKHSNAANNIKIIILNKFKKTLFRLIKFKIDINETKLIQNTDIEI